MSHPLHVKIAGEIEKWLDGSCELIRDTACGGSRRLSLFIERRGRDTRMCQVDLLVVKSGQVRVIVEIEESGFLPTKICGKFFQAALANNFIHDSRTEPALPYADQVSFVQVLDGSKCLKEGTKKDLQAKLIKQQIRSMLPLKGSRIVDYQLFFVLGAHDRAGLESVGRTVAETLT